MGKTVTDIAVINVDSNLNPGVASGDLQAPSKSQKKNRKRRALAKMKKAVQETGAKTTPKKPATKCDPNEGGGKGGASQPQKKEPCEYAEIKISASSAKKGDLTLPIKAKKKTIDIISGHSMGVSTVSAELIGLQGPCKKGSEHENRTFDCVDEGAKKSSSKFQLDMPYLDDYKIFLWNSKPSWYNFQSNTCNGGNRIQVRVFPDSELEGEIRLGKITLGLNREKNKPEEKETKQGVLAVKGSFKRNGGIKSELEGEFTQIVDDIESLYKVIHKVDGVVNRLKPAKSSRLFSYEADFIGFGYKFNAKYKEFEAFQCDLNHEHEIGFDPMVRVKLKSDIIDLALRAYAVGSPLASLKSYLEENEWAELSLEASVEGVIAGTANVKKEAGKKKTEVSTSIKGSLEIGIVGLAKSAVFGCETGASMGGSSKIEFPVELNEEGITIGYKFNGVKIMATVYLEVGIKSFKVKGTKGYEGTFLEMEDPSTITIIKFKS